MQPHLDFTPVPAPRFDSGVPLTQADHRRLTGQLARVYSVLCDGSWWTVSGIHAAIQQRFQAHDPEPSISAQLRNLRKAKFGGYQIERRHHDGVYQFRYVCGQE